MKSKFVVAVLFVLLMAGMVAPLLAQATAASPKLSITIERTIRVGQYGVIHTTDDFTVFNNDTSASVSHLDFGFPRDERQYYYWIEAQDSNGKKLTLDADVNQSSDFYWLRANFASPVNFNQTYKFTVTSVLNGVIAPVITGFIYNMTAAPVLTQDARLANVTFLAVPASDFHYETNSTYYEGTIQGLPALINEYKPWKAYSKARFLAPYATVNQYVLNFTSYNRDIIIGNDGSLSVDETYSMFNPSIPITSLTITLPDGSYNVMAYDPVGALWAAPQNPGSPYQVTISPRYNLGIRSNETYTFTLTYNLPSSTYIKQLDWWGDYNLTITLLDNRNDVVFDNARVRILTPPGVRLANLQMAPLSPIAPPLQIGPDYRNFTMQGVTSFTNLNVGLNVKYIPFVAGSEFLPWVFGLEAIVAVVAIGYRIRRGPELKVPIPVEKLREFVGLYDEKLALSRELIEMEEDVSRGSLVKHEFRRRSKVIELRLDDLNKSLAQVKADLRALGARYGEMMNRLDRAEAEITASRASLGQVRSQYRAGKTTRDAYDSISYDISKRIDRAEETVETTLITLREEAR